MARYSIPIIYTPGGINKKLPPTLLRATEAIDGLNFDITPGLDLVKRSGFHMRADSDLGYGLTLHENREPILVTAVGFGDFNFGEDAFGSPTSLGLGAIEPQMVGISTTPKLWTQGNISITYAGTGTATITVHASASASLELLLKVDGAIVLTRDLGDGTEVSPVTLTALDTSIDAISDFTSIITGTATTPAAFIDLRDDEPVIMDNPHEIDFGYWTSINTPVASPLAEMAGRTGRDDFENPTSTNLNSVLYIQDGFDPMKKYDGQNLYNAGLPVATVPTLAVDTGTPSAAGMSGVYKYRIQYRQIDNMLLIYEGAISSISASADNSAGPYAIDVTCTNLLTASGYNVNGAYTAGVHTSTNVGASQERLTVDNGSGADHTLQIGDTAYLYDINASAYITAEVLARTSSTITVTSSSTLSVGDNQIISNNLRIEIWRTDAGGSTYSLVVELPNDPFSSTQDYSDILADTVLGASYSAPSKTPGVATPCKYITTWKSQLICSGDPLNPGRVYYSEYDGTTLSGENFPAVNFFDIAIGSRGSASITGLQALGEDLIIFTEDRCFWASGNLVADDITVSEISDNIGCVAHATIASIESSVFFLSKTGIYLISPSAQRSNYIIDKLSTQLDPIFLRGADNNYRKSRRRAQAVVWPSTQKYVLYLPDADTSSGEWYSKDSARVWVYDIDRGEWYQWDNIHPMAGMLIWDDGTESSDSVLWFHTRTLDSADNTVVKQLYKFNHTDSETDFADHTSAISMNYRPQWEFLSAPRIQKLYNEIAIDAFRSTAELQYTPSGTITIGVYRDFDDTTEEVTMTADYIANNQEIIKSLPRSIRRSLGLKFSNSELNKQILISGWSIEGFPLNSNIRR